MLNRFDLDRRDGGAIERGQNRSTQRIAECGPVPSFKGLTNKFAVCLRAGHLDFFGLNNFPPVHVHKFV